MHYPGEGSNRPDPLEPALRRSQSPGLDQEEEEKKMISVGKDSKNDYGNVVEVKKLGRQMKGVGGGCRWDDDT